MLRNQYLTSTLNQNMRFLLLLCLSACCLTIAAQPFAIGRQTITLTDPARSNRSIPSEIFYPATTAGSNTTVATGSFPVIVFGHGFSMNFDAYANFWNELVPQGYILAFPKTEIGPIPFPAHGELAADMNYTITWFIAENTTSTSRYFNRVNGKFAVMGHSMGGGCSYIAAANNPNVTAIANFAAAETNPSAIAAAANITIPALVFAGSKDCVAGPSGNQVPMYNALASVCKSYVNITDGSHCQFGESNTLCNFGETTSCPFANYISRSAQHSKTFQYLNPFLRFYLKGDCNAWPIYQQLLASPTGAVVQNSCNYQLPNATITVNGPTNLCAGDSTILVANANNSYLWTGGTTQQQLTVTQASVYTLVVADAIGCTDTATQTITQTNLQVQASITNANCGGNDGQASLAVSGGAVPYTYLWPNSETTNSVDSLASGSYPVTITDGNSCTTTFTVNISAPGTLAVNISASPTTCPNGNDGLAIATVSGGTPPYTYSWQGFPLVNANTVDSYAPGVHLLTITDANGCTSIDSFEIRQPALWSPPIVSLTGTQLCEGDTARLVPIDNYDAYLWSTGDTTQTLLATQSGFYNCTVTAGNGCTVSGVGVTINFYQDYLNPEILLAGDSLYISEGTVSSWVLDGATVPNANGNYILNPAPGGYYAVVLDSNGCEYIAKSYTITVGINDGAFAALRLYPNPASQTLLVEGLPVGAQVLLYDLLGKKYAVDVLPLGANMLQIDVQHLPAQLYLLQMVAGENTYIRKVIISR